MYRIFLICGLIALTAVGCSDSDSKGSNPTSPTSTPPSPASMSNASFEDQVLTLVNQRRAAGATCGGFTRSPVAPLAMHETLRTVARLHSQDMATNNYFSHTGLDGRGPVERIRAAGYPLSGAVGENIARGSPTAQAVVDGWMASPEHCGILMQAGFRVTGIGYASTYWTQVFTTN